MNGTPDARRTARTIRTRVASERKGPPRGDAKRPGETTFAPLRARRNLVSISRSSPPKYAVRSVPPPVPFPRRTSTVPLWTSRSANPSRSSSPFRRPVYMKVPRIATARARSNGVGHGKCSAAWRTWRSSPSLRAFGTSRGSGGGFMPRKGFATASRRSRSLKNVRSPRQSELMVTPDSRRLLFQAIHASTANMRWPRMASSDASDARNFRKLSYAHRYPRSECGLFRWTCSAWSRKSRNRRSSIRTVHRLDSPPNGVRKPLPGSGRGAGVTCRGSAEGREALACAECRACWG